MRGAGELAACCAAARARGLGSAALVSVVAGGAAADDHGRGYAVGDFDPAIGLGVGLSRCCGGGGADVGVEFDDEVVVLLGGATFAVVGRGGLELYSVEDGDLLEIVLLLGGVLEEVFGLDGAGLAVGSRGLRLND